jgi:hypothetical protein
MLAFFCMRHHISYAMTMLKDLDIMKTRGVPNCIANTLRGLATGRASGAEVFFANKLYGGRCEGNHQSKGSEFLDLGHLSACMELFRTLRHMRRLNDPVSWGILGSGVGPPAVQQPPRQALSARVKSGRVDRHVIVAFCTSSPDKLYFVVWAFHARQIMRQINMLMLW